ncbi:MAG: hypothetical protein V4506_03795 [Bacteroidota bacterium]
MSTHKYSNTKQTSTVNLIGEWYYRSFIKLQADYGFAQRGGVVCPYADTHHLKRLASKVNILSSKEQKQLIFSESIFSN